MSSPNNGPAMDLESLVGKAAGEFTERVQRGERPDLDEFLRRYPEVADVLRQVLPALECVAPEPSGSVAGSPAPRELGDFHIVREIGRGGMGIVYEAEQISLKRQVALKLLPAAAALDGHRLSRFKNEAQAAAQLHHNHIVPIYAVGAEGGYHYYAMQLIGGQNLADMIRHLRDLVDAKSEPCAESELRAQTDTDAKDRSTLPHFPSPTYFRTAAQLGMQAALALHHAHQVGILHRDVKPANLLVSAGCHLWITDFGLARLQDETRLTQTGDLLGTLHYMSPEQALGQSAMVDQRSDVYSLGATLYELATLEPLFRGEGREALLRQISQDEPRRPRRLNPAVPVELETLILKAVAKSPGERYLTAGEMADDLQRFLEDQPIRARPPTLVQRTSRFLRRHRALAASVAAFLFLGLIGLGVANFLLWQANERVQEESDRAQKALGREATQRGRAEQNLGLALRALNDIHLQLAKKQLLRDPRFKKDAENLLRELVGFYEAFAASNADEPAVNQENAKSLLAVSDIYDLLGDTAKAEQANLRACSLLTRLRGELPDHPEVENLWAAAKKYLGTLYHDSGRPIEAEKELEAARRAFESLHRRWPAIAAYRANLSSMNLLLGDVHFALGRVSQAEAAYRTALALQDGPAGDFHVQRMFRSELASALANLGNLLNHNSRPAEAKKLLMRASARFEGMLAESPDDAHFLKELARAQQMLGAAEHKLAQFAEAEKSYLRAKDLLQSLNEGFPSVPVYRWHLSNVLGGLGQVYDDTGRREKAWQAIEGAVAYREKLAADFPGQPDYQRALAGSLNDIAQMQSADGRSAEAVPLLRRAVSILDRELSRDPENARLAENMAFLCNNLGMELQRLKQLPEAESLIRKALDLLQKTAIVQPDKQPPPHEMAVSFDHLGIIVASQGRYAEAIKFFHRALELRQKLASEFGDVLGYQVNHARTLYNLGLAHVQAGDARAARPFLERSLKQTSPLHELHPNQPEIARALQMRHALLITVDLGLRDHAAAAQTASDLARIFPDPETGVGAAANIAQCVSLVEANLHLPVAERATALDKYTGQIFALLRRAVDQGFRDTQRLADRRFDSLRQEPEFRALVERIKKNGK